MYLMLRVNDAAFPIVASSNQMWFNGFKQQLQIIGSSAAASGTRVAMCAEQQRHASVASPLRSAFNIKMTSLSEGP